MKRPLLIDEIAQEVIQLLDPYKSIQRKLEVYHREIRAGDFSLKADQKIHLFAVGKAASFQLEALIKFFKDTVLSERLGRCVSYTKRGHTVAGRNFIQLEGDHPLISSDNLRQTQVFLNYLSEIEKGDTVLFLISGGTSALLEQPSGELNFESLQKAHEEILNSGLGINEMNAKRRQLSLIKGGGLKKFIKTPHVLQMLTSDIPNNKLSDIGSGPLFGEGGEDPHAVVLQSADLLMEGLVRKFPFCEVGKIYDCQFPEMEDDLLEILKQKNKSDFFHLSGGEATIQVPANAIAGGRNTHFVLSMGQKIYGDESYKDLWDVQIMSLGTDGSDGNTPCAGAFLNYDLWSKKEAQTYLDSFNSYGYFKELDTLIDTGPTKTNVMDLRLLWRLS